MFFLGCGFPHDLLELDLCESCLEDQLDGCDCDILQFMDLYAEELLCVNDL